MVHVNTWQNFQEFQLTSSIEPILYEKGVQGMYNNNTYDFSIMSVLNSYNF